MLQDEAFRRTSRCGYWKKLLAEKESLVADISGATVSSCEITLAKFNSEGFDRPLLVSSGDSADNSFIQLGGKIPPSLYSSGNGNSSGYLDEVSSSLGALHPVKLIEVGSQNQIEGYTLGDYSQYLNNYIPKEHKVLNMITLELSHTPYANQITAPSIVSQIDWIDVIWPIERRSRGDFPSVQKYCLSGMAQSYTDFHIDFGGTSVWYHVVRGSKKFYLIPPSSANLIKFIEWNNTTNQDEVWFGDLVGKGEVFSVTVKEGQTFFIPGGWIHSVYTPEDALVFGGNFLCSYNIIRQLQVYEIEVYTRISKAYRFPFFLQLNVYFLCEMLNPFKKILKKQFSSKDHENSDSDDDDEEDDIYLMGSSFLFKNTFAQLKFIVKAVEIWVSQGKKNLCQPFLHGNHDEITLSKTIIRENGKFEDVNDLITKWWSLLNTYSPSILDSSASSEEEKFTEIKESTIDMNLLNYYVTENSLKLMQRSYTETVLSFGEYNTFRNLSSPQSHSVQISEMEMVPVIKVEEKNWVECTLCGKWRSIPMDVVAEELLPDDWNCSLNVWDSSKQTCEDPEEVYEEEITHLSPLENEKEKEKPVLKLTLNARVPSVESKESKEENGDEKKNVLRIKRNRTELAVSKAGNSTSVDKGDATISNGDKGKVKTESSSGNPKQGERKRVKLNLPPKPPPKVAPREYDISYEKLETVADSNAGEIYGTRRKKLSKTFLLQHADVDMDDEDEITSKPVSGDSSSSSRATISQSSHTFDNGKEEEYDEFEDGDDAEVDATVSAADFAMSSDEEEEEEEEDEDYAISDNEDDFIMEDEDDDEGNSKNKRVKKGKPKKVNPFQVQKFKPPPSTSTSSHQSSSSSNSKAGFGVGQAAKAVGSAKEPSKPVTAKKTGSSRGNILKVLGKRF